MTLMTSRTYGEHRELGVHGWLVTATHVTWAGEPTQGSDEPLEYPFGVGHLRRVGGHRTACGVPALNWPILWATHPDHVSNLCEECHRLVGAVLNF